MGASAAQAGGTGMVLCSRQHKVYRIRQNKWGRFHVQGGGVFVALSKVPTGTQGVAVAGGAGTAVIMAAACGGKGTKPTAGRRIQFWVCRVP